MGVLVSLRIRKIGGVLFSARKMRRVFATKGLRGVNVRLMNDAHMRDLMAAHVPVNQRLVLLPQIEKASTSTRFPSR
jgi:hypothetical protein